MQLGTGAEGSGVGIIVDNNASKSDSVRGVIISGVLERRIDIRSGKAGAAAEKRDVEKRDVDDNAAPKRRSKVTTLYVRRGVPTCEFCG